MSKVTDPPDVPPEADNTRVSPAAPVTTSTLSADCVALATVNTWVIVRWVNPLAACCVALRVVDPAPRTVIEKVRAPVALIVATEEFELVNVTEPELFELTVTGSGDTPKTPGSKADNVREGV